ncbi:hypothetical protein [Rhodocyclus tenuis]|uniref:Uncharacterized protein n=1 Tax=Rhodocyclus tenuis TaxID=1066 RepID=A0A840G296_RHOTE|nr:hypothetical protein [Rhodocyclus tenuis]MBB4248517.1 hypothetical protein [Rhodocyclus tenuis]
MKPREFKLTLPASAPNVVSLELARLRRYMRDLSPTYDPARDLRTRRFKAEAIRRKTGGFPGR